MKVNIEVEITEEGYELKTSVDGKLLALWKNEYKGKGCTERVETKGHISDSELEDAIEDIDMAANDIMFLVQEAIEEDEE